MDYIFGCILVTVCIVGVSIFLSCILSALTSIPKIVKSLDNISDQLKRMNYMVKESKTEQSLMPSMYLQNIKNIDRDKDIQPFDWNSFVPFGSPLDEDTHSTTEGE